ncbi:zinc ribbon domain-containing protein [Rarobacter incanus]|uniref:Uncharacterized protein n=1 Tax=Rarobacter incanus TaxID=153494 RepID=A0A542SML1_9MICO|nr:C4-type zinc ribbon domain-containing protein [Rarobacter incanus]TQK75871.1 hypothetical protein FB389_0511 [Rarobacter incanus]
MATASVADQQTILAVQALDTRAQQLVHQRRTLPIHAKIAEYGERLADLERALVASRTEAADLTLEAKKAEHEVALVRERAVRDQALLDAGKVSAKEAQALLAELDSLKVRQGRLEEVELDVMERLEAHQATLAQLEQAYDGTVADRNRAVRERDDEVAAIDAQRKDVARERAAAVEGLDVTLLATYERLRDQLGGLGAARLEGRRCGGCRMELNPVDLSKIAAASAETLVRCEECGRLLVRPIGQDA